jgi:methionyl aminopeptidase
MSITIKTDKEIELMRKSGKILSDIVEEVSQKVREGISTLKLDKFAQDLCKRNAVKPAFLGYRGYPASLCLGVNDTVVHGIPSEDEILKEGDIISLDMGVIYKGYYSDKAITVGVGKIAGNAHKLINATEDALFAGIKQAKVGNTVGHIGFAIESVVDLAGFSVVRQMVGHGIGKALHEDPQIPGFGKRGEGERLENGMTIAIEAIINEGSSDIEFLEDGWTTKTSDGKLSALFEHTVVVRERKATILTK